MKTIQSQAQQEELKKVVEQIVKDLESSHLFTGKLSIVRVPPPAGAPTNTPAGYPHLMVQEEIQKKCLGLIPCKKRQTILSVKEGFYDMEDKGKKDMFVLLSSKNAEVIVKKHLDEYGRKNQVSEIIYKA
jgi:hypothetical protein